MNIIIIVIVIIIITIIIIIIITNIVTFVGLDRYGLKTKANSERFITTIMMMVIMINSSGLAFRSR